MPKHGVRLILLLGVLFAAAVGAKSYFTADSFYQFGHYRGDSVVEIAAVAPVHKGSDYCLTCHTDRHAEWSAGIHKVVKCEVCHGAAGEHPASGKLPVPTDTVRLCSVCHEAMPARPAAQPQIEISEHAGKRQCIKCHNPHSPRNGDAVAAPHVERAAANTLSAKCTACHGADGLGNGNFPPLAGKQAEYLVQQLYDYKSGTRQNAMMNVIAKTLSEQDIADLAAHYASLKGKTAQ